uniref:Uncharacterized protein n=1 Tax=Brassica oleracea var. oleracea TaxID=109376 RepID=A0A0D3DEJ5_BRAOL
MASPLLVSGRSGRSGHITLEALIISQIISSVTSSFWSPDSRMLLSGSKDSTLKIWDIGLRQLKQDLPGHADEVYAVDWSPDGERVVSGGKDKSLKLWVG